MRRRAFGTTLLLTTFLFVLPSVESFAQDKKKADQEKPKPKPIDSATLTSREYAGKLTSVPGTDRLFLLETDSTKATPTGITGGRYRPLTIKYKADHVYNEIEFQVTEKVKVRTMILPEQFDEKGNVKKYSSAELAKLRGKDAQLGGYESSLDKLEVGQKVRVVLTNVASKPASKDKDTAVAPEKRVQVKAIFILAEPSAEKWPAGKAKKK